MPRLVAGACLAGLSALAAAAEEAAGPTGRTVAASLADLSLEQLRDVVVTTVSRGDQRLDRVAASVFVIGAEDIRRSGATTLAEALRLAPTLDVARADSSQYAISARGFSNVARQQDAGADRRPHRLHAAVLGRVLGGAGRDARGRRPDRGGHRPEHRALGQQRGQRPDPRHHPRRFRDTQGALGSLRAGNRDRGAAARYGGTLGEDGRFRVYARYYDREHQPSRRRQRARRRGARRPGGIPRRLGHGRDDALTLQGDVYHGDIDQAAAGARRFSGANVLGRWQRRFGDGSELSVKMYADHTEREHPQSFAQRLDTVDAVVQYAFQPVPGHAVVLGGGHRHAWDRVETSSSFAFVPGKRALSWSRLFAQDQIDLTPTLNLTLSGSVESNPYTGAEVLPGLRLGWTTTEGNLLWAAYSRAVRAPSRIDREFFSPAQPPFSIAGGPRFDAEISNVFELGYRSQSSSRLSYSLTLFDAEHRRLRSLSPTPSGLQFENDVRGFTRGLETWGRWRVSDRWRLDAGLVLQNQKLRVRDGAVDAAGLASLGNDPRHFASIRSALDFGPAWTWSLAVRRVGARPDPDVPGYTAVDTRVAWKVNEHADIAFGAHNLFDRRHPEWGPATSRAEIERSVFVQLQLRR